MKIFDAMTLKLARLTLPVCVLVSGTMLYATAANAQLAAHIVAANGAGSDIYAVEFSGSGGTTTVLNTDSNAHTGIRSLVFRPSLDTGDIDLIAADTSRGELLLYVKGIGNAQVLWRQASGVAYPQQGAGPVRPDGLSLDGYGNLYVVSSASGNSIAPELWVFPRNAFGSLPGGFDKPRRVDNGFASGQQLVETLSVRTAGSLGQVGSLLVLTSSPAQVFQYSASALQAVLAATSVPVTATPSALIGSLPANTSPGGMDFLPIDGSLLITSYDRILKYSSPSSYTLFATGLGNGVNNKFKIRTARVGTNAIAVIADNSNGRLLEFDSNGLIVAVITSGVNRPQALASTNAATAAATCYQQSAGCDVLGGVLKHKALNIPPQSANGFILQEPCVVNTDPRYNATTGTWSDVPLPIANVCPGIGNSVIPAYLRGGSGSTGKGFAIVSSTSNFLLPLGAEVTSEIYSENILGAKPLCTAPFSAEIVTWAPTAGEGSIVEGSTAQLDATTGCVNPLLAGTRGASDWTFGLVLDTTSSALTGANATQKLHNFSAGKYVNLLATVEAAQIKKQVKSALVKCLNGSKSDFDKFSYATALTKLQTCDQQVRSAYAGNPGDFQSSASNPNPYGEIVTRIANLDYTIRYRQLQP